MLTLVLKALFPNIFLASFGGSLILCSSSPTSELHWPQQPVIDNCNLWQERVFGVFLFCFKGLAHHVLDAKNLNFEVLIRSYFSET